MTRNTFLDFGDLWALLNNGEIQTTLGKLRLNTSKTEYEDRKKELLESLKELEQIKTELIQDSFSFINDDLVQCDKCQKVFDLGYDKTGFYDLEDHYYTHTHTKEEHTQAVKRINKAWE